MKISFGARAIITEPDDGNEEYLGRVGIVLDELPSDSNGRRFKVAFEGEPFLPLLYLHEMTVQKEAVKYLPAEVEVREVKVPREPSRVESLELAIAALTKEAGRIKGRHKG